MPIDAVFLESLRCELQQQLLACRVDKVQQPERDTILLSMRGPNGGGKLLLTVSDTQGNAEIGQSEAERLIEEVGVDVIIGRCSACCCESI